MKLAEALAILQRDLSVEREPLTISLACSFSPLHLKTMLAAHLKIRKANRRIALETGQYGDLLGNIERLSDQHDAAVVIIEWNDLDPRLGIRSLAKWNVAILDDILKDAEVRSAHLLGSLSNSGRSTPVFVVLPTLPLPPVAHTTGWQASTFELDLRRLVSVLAAQIARLANVQVLNPQRLDSVSPLNDRLDVAAEMSAGFPYSLSHASALGALLSQLIVREQPKKGLITDLDNTLWRGILGDDDVDGVSWSLEHQSHIHGLYQQLLHALSDSGVMIGVASKNDQELVEAALQRADLIIERDRLFPLDVHWGPKSESVSRILSTWNIGPESAVVVDDSRSELDEVRSVHPLVECIHFPYNDPKAAYLVLDHLRDMFGKSRIEEEDAIRLESIRRSHGRHERSAGASIVRNDTLEQRDAQITFTFHLDPSNTRALELVNKTNQFNLNGRKHTEGSWQTFLMSPDAFLVVASYEDKYGPLGRIAVLAGRHVGDTLYVDTWAMSCRAFARRIEHRCLQKLYDHFGVTVIVFDYLQTPRNGPIRMFLEQLLDTSPMPQCRLTKERFSAMYATTAALKSHMEDTTVVRK